ncbi:MAG: hypothetical protein LBD74_00075 [Spirochaetaceae bacterium]|jgi:hypothetical protein|nr:hypothetical protein [Spirochaetaceae bacterium]
MSTARTLSSKSPRGYARKPAKKVSLDDVWAGFIELQKNNAELQKNNAEIQAAIKETQKVHAETEKAIQDLKETVKETSRIVGDLGNKFGDEAEHTLIPGLPEKLKLFGFHFTVINRNRKIKDPQDHLLAEVDAFLENRTQTMAVEVKARLHKADVDGHLRRMETLRRYADQHGDGRDLFGALAATVVGPGERKYALERGFYVVEPSGEDVRVSPPHPSPRIWPPALEGV